MARRTKAAPPAPAWPPKQAAPRGPGVFRYTRAVVVAAVGGDIAGLRSAERRGELVMGDLVSVARFIVRRVGAGERPSLAGALPQNLRLPQNPPPLPQNPPRRRLGRSECFRE